MLEADLSGNAKVKELLSPRCQNSTPERHDCERQLQDIDLDLTSYIRDLSNVDLWFWESEKEQHKISHWNHLVCAQKLVDFFKRHCVPQA